MTHLFVSGQCVRTLKMLDIIKKFYSGTNRWHRILLVFLGLHSGLIPTRHLGFYCNDPKLSHPYTGDTVSWKLLLLYTAFQPLVLMLVFERLYHPVAVNGMKIKNYFLKWYKEYLYSVLTNMNIVQMLKICVGEPRPHFFDTCRPEEAAICEESEYITTYTCTRTNWLTDSVKSFPSGHSALGIHCGMFVAWYLHTRIRKATDKARRVVYITQAACLFVSIFCAVSRIYDNRHHWWDVLVGAGIGISIIWYTVKIPCDNFNCPKLMKNNEDMQSTINDSKEL